MPGDHRLRIEANRPVSASCFLLTLASDSDLPPWEPGQFAMICTGDRTDPLLRRPFSIYNLCDPAERGRKVQILYKVVGRGTAILASMRSGETLRALLPLGRGFAPVRDRGDQIVLVAGGVGVASLHSLGAAELRSGGSPLLLFGCRTAAEISVAAPTRDLGIETIISTDDGSAGFHGLVPVLLDATLRDRGAGGRIVCACGPMPMMKAVAEIASRHGARCYLSLESTMGCGFGVCSGCVIGVRRAPGEPLSYRRTCIDGPVMDASEVLS